MTLPVFAECSDMTVEGLDELTNVRANSLLSGLWWDKRLKKLEKVWWGEPNEDGFIPLEPMARPICSTSLRTQRGLFMRKVNGH